MTYYDTILNKELLQIEFVENKKTSRQIAREYRASRKIINVLLLKYGFVNRRDLDDNDLP